MNKPIRRYRRAVARDLACGLFRRQRLLGVLDGMLAPFLEECPDPEMAALTAAFGPPEAVAAELMAQVPEEEKYRFALWRRFRIVLYAVVLLTVFLFGFWAYYLKEWTVIKVHDTVNIIYETESSEQSGE